MLRNVSVREVMNGEYLGVSESDELGGTVELLLAEDADVAVVLRGTDPVGVLTDRDALAALVGDDVAPMAPVESAMTGTVPTIEPDRGLDEARDRMTTLGLGWLVVSDGDGLLGVVTEHDILAGSTIDREDPAGPPKARDEGGMTASSSATATASRDTSDDAFEDQGICEVCGTLTVDLATVNGQLRCPDCRDV